MAISIAIAVKMIPSIILRDRLISHIHYLFTNIEYHMRYDILLVSLSIHTYHLNHLKSVRNYPHWEELPPEEED